MSDTPESGFFDREVDGRPYVVFVPKGVKGPLPSILFLHGMGESGTDGLLQVSVGIGPALMRNRDRWPFLVVLPQKPVHRELWPEHANYLSKVLDAVQKEFEPDPHRRYLTGLSQGGHGTFHLVRNLSWQFAAAAAVCGWVAPETAVRNFRGIPLWAFHGEKDPVVPAEASRRAVQALQEAGEDAKLTLYPDVGHNSWDSAYAEEQLPKWLLSHRLD